MKIKIFFAFFIILLIFPFISADTITPGYSPITINNYITNINDFPNYIFVSGSPLTERAGPGIAMCGLKMVSADGKISGTYKFCPISIFAIEKSKWDSERAQIFMTYTNKTPTQQEYLDFMNSIDAKEVIKDIEHYKETADFSIIRGEDNYYTIDLNQVKEKPDDTKNKLGYGFIFLLLISLIALLIIINIIRKRNKK